MFIIIYFYSSPLSYCPCKVYIPSPPAMVLSSLFFLDLKGKILISRDYRGDISPSHAEEFIELLSEREISMEMGENGDGMGVIPSGASSSAGSVSNVQPPIFHKNGISYCYTKYNNLYSKLTRKVSFLFIFCSSCDE